MCDRDGVRLPISVGPATRTAFLEEVGGWVGCVAHAREGGEGAHPDAVHEGRWEGLECMVQCARKGMLPCRAPAASPTPPHPPLHHPLQSYSKPTPPPPPHPPAIR